MRRTLPVLVFFLAVALSACSLASDITPPPGYRPPTAAQAPTAAAVVYPVVPPDPAQGAALYADKCLPCHGSTGMGDGPQAAKLSNPVTAIGSQDKARLAKPVDWYNVITNGRMDRFMPPFRSALTDRQRWDVLAYVLSFTNSAQLVQQAKPVYEESCAACHGSAGKGDGTQAASLKTKMLDWSDLSRLANRSANDLFQVLSNGSAPDMPAYAGKLDESQRWALTAYIRTLSFAGNGSGNAVAAQNPAPAATTAPAAQTTPQPAGTAQATKINITGKIVNNSGTPLPADLSVTLLSFDAAQQALPSIEAKVAGDGSYAFKDVDVATGSVFMAQVQVQTVTFFSLPLHASDVVAGTDPDLSISITAASNDFSVIRGQRLHVFFDFSVANVLQVAELFIIQNPSDKALVPADPTNPTLRFDLPAGATNLFFEDGTLGDGRYFKTEKGFADNQSIQPQGVTQVLFGYEMPYSTGQSDLVIPLPIAVDSAVVMVPAGSVKVTGDQVVSAGTSTPSGSTSALALYTASNLAAGTQLKLQVSGAPASSPAAATDTTGSSNSPTFLIIGLGVFGLALVVGGVWMLRQRKPAGAGSPEMAAADEQESAESILDTIVALDDLYQAGGLPESAYRERRAELKDRLRALRG